MSNKSWKFTLNNWTPEDRKFFELMDANIVVFSEEIAPDTGTPHLQGHITFKRSYRLSALKKLHARVHWEPAKCNDYNYELKGSNVYVRDKRSQGKRNDLSEIAELIKKKTPMRQIATDYPGQFIRYHRGFHALQDILISPRSTPPTIKVYYGGTGTGKSRRAREELKSPYIWHPQCGEWFNGYYGQDEAIFEEFRGQLKLGFLLTICDRYDCKVQTKGGMTEFRATDIIITSPIHPRQWYEKCQCEDVWSQLNRRLTHIICLENCDRDRSDE